MFRQKRMRLPPLPTWRLSGLSQPLIVNERRPRRSSTVAVAGLHPAPRRAVGQVERAVSVRRGGAVQFQRRHLALGNAGTHDRVGSLRSTAICTNDRALPPSASVTVSVTV